MTDQNKILNQTFNIVTDQYIDTFQQLEDARLEELSRMADGENNLDQLVRIQDKMTKLKQAYDDFYKSFEEMLKVLQ